MSGRFTVTYRIATADSADARTRAEAIAREQTLEAPPEATTPAIEAALLGRVDALHRDGEAHVAQISYDPNSAGPDFAQFLNVMFGNSSLQRGLKVVGLDAGPIASLHAGPRFGIDGIRRLCGRPRGGMIAPVLKPMGLAPADLALIAGRCAAAGADIVKEDHGLADQPSAPYRARLPRIVEAVAEANARAGARTLYFATLAGTHEHLEDNIAFARQAGVDGLILMPGLTGFGLVARLAAEGALPVMTHPAFLGGWTAAPGSGIAHDVLFGTLMRLAGADISVFPNWGGRFGFTQGECLAIARACRDAAGAGRPMLPSPGGGMSVERAGDMASAYGEDVVYLLGGSLLAMRERIGDGIYRMREAIDAATGS